MRLSMDYFDNWPVRLWDARVKKEHIDSVSQALIFEANKPFLGFMSFSEKNP